MSRIIRIVHVSDMHIEGELFKNKDYLLDTLLDDIESFRKKKDIDIVVYSGDMIEKGGYGFSSTEEAIQYFADEVLNKIEKKVGIERERVIVCPGNHDVDTSSIEEYEELGLRKHKLTTRKKINNFISNAREGEGSISRLEPYNEFEKEYYKGYENVEVSQFDTNYNINMGDLVVGASSLNNVWRYYSGLDDRREMILGNEQIERAINKTAMCDIRIAVMHYPVGYLKDLEKDDIRNKLFDHYDMLLTGHTHKEDARLENRVIGGLFRSSSPGVLRRNMGKGNKYKNGYKVFDFDISELQIIQHNRVFSDSKLEFVKDNETSEEDGKTVFSIPSAEQLQALKKQRELADTVREVRYDQLNEDLVTYGTDTNAPPRVQDLFVMPPVVRRHKEEDDVKEETYSLQDLAFGDESILLRGEKETGKTMLLYRLLVEINEGLEVRNEVPVFIDFKNIGNKKIITKIKEFFAINTSDAKEISRESDIVLLVDDIDFSDKYQIEIQNLLRYIDEYENVRVIATTDKRHSADVALSEKGMEVASEIGMTPLEIRKFKINQIKELISKWYGKEYTKSKKDKVNDLVKLYGDLDIPRTPLSVSIYLWIFEKQEGYRPKNRSTMIENFIEKLFDKHSTTERLSEKFDFRNKQRLLASIARYMEEIGQDSYKVEYDKICKFTREYLEKRKFNYPSDKIIDGFVNVGILKKDGDFVRFKFTCFFEFFLMKAMQYDDGGMEDEILSEENYLKYINEIDFLTGIERDRDDILNLMVERIENAFSDLRSRLLENNEDIDSYFQSSSMSLSSIPRDDFIESISKIESPSSDEIEKGQDLYLDYTESQRSGEIRQKEIPDDRLSKLDRLLMLTSRVLKNTEEIEDADLKKNAYRNLVTNLAAFSVLYTEKLRDIAEQEDIPVETEDFIDASRTVYPFLIQHTLLEQAGTKKLTLVIKEEIERTLGNSRVSDFRKFVNVFMYSDIVPGDYHKYIKNLIDEVSSNYIYLNTDIKLKSYLYLKSDSESEEMENIKLLAHNFCISRGKDISKKGKIIQELKDEKLRKDMSGDDSSQMKLPI